MRIALRALWIAGLALLSPAQQLVPPTLPRVNHNACPFECCQFGRWTAKQNVAAYEEWHRSRHRLFEIQKGQTVTALTGVHVTYKPGHLRAMKAVPELHMKPGDTVLTHM